MLAKFHCAGGNLHASVPWEALNGAFRQHKGQDEESPVPVTKGSPGISI